MKSNLLKIKLAKFIQLYIILIIMLLNIQMVDSGINIKENISLLSNNPQINDTKYILQNQDQSIPISRSFLKQKPEIKYIEDNFTDESQISSKENIIIDTEKTETRLLSYNYTFHKILALSDGVDRNYSIIQTSDSGFIIICTLSFYGILDVGLIKTDTFGNLQWLKNFGNMNSDYGESVLETEDNGFMILGTTTSYGAGREDIWVIKTDAEGNLKWDETFGGQFSDFGSEICKTHDGNFMIIGTTSSYGTGHEDIWLIKIDDSGNMLWNKTFGGNKNDTGRSIHVTTEGEYVIIGETESFGNGLKDIWFVKLNESGELIWNMTFGKDSNDYSEMIRQTSNGNYILIGTTKLPDDPNGLEIWVLNINKNGKVQWEKLIGGKRDDYGYSIQQTTDKGYIIMSITESFGYGRRDVWLIKLDANGNEEWNKTFGSSFDDYCTSVTQSADGGYIFVGTSWPKWNIWLTKFDGFENINNHGLLISNNILHGNFAESFNYFNYTANIPNETEIKLQFSQDNISWYDSRGILNTWETLSNGSHSIELSSLPWRGANFYYKVNFSSENMNVSALRYINLSYLENPDSDEDNIPDFEDSDDDNDNYLDAWEEYLDTNPKDANDKPVDTDNDGAPDGDPDNSQPWMDTDDDNDSMLDSWEREYLLNPLTPNDAELDYDMDKFTNKEEYDADTDPWDPDDHPEVDDNDNKEPQGDDYTIYVILIIFIIMILIVLALILNTKKKKKK